MMVSTGQYAGYMLTEIPSDELIRQYEDKANSAELRASLRAELAKRLDFTNMDAVLYDIIRHTYAQ